ncbi:MAG TPA: hypothetical protein VEL75_06085 [Candidatus Methylomirabilis sp.]|nr:hypothetical protein [Candidatus Methylomirabilis sp.]
MTALGATSLPLIVIQHPLGGEPPEGVSKRVAQAVEQLSSILGAARTPARAAAAGQAAAAPSREVDHGGVAHPETTVLDEDDVYAEFVRREWCDGLPIVAPTRERVDAMLAGAGLDGSVSLGAMPPLWRDSTVEKLAVNAVMAGCEPGVFPIVVAAVRAMLDHEFNLYGVQATTHPVAPLLIVSGPIARATGLHAGAGLFGPGFRANATLGRAIRLILMNVGGGWPGRDDMATQGSPAKFSYAIAERADASPWEPLHVGLGFPADQSVVTVYGGEAPHNVNDHVDTTAAGILNNVADVATTLGSNVGWYFSQSQLLVVLGPEHAATIAADGFSKADVRRFVFEHARLPLARLKLSGMWGMHDWPVWMQKATDDSVMLPRVPSADDVFVIVAGGSGKHSAVVPNCTFSRAVSRVIERGPARPGGRPAP